MTRVNLKVNYICKMTWTHESLKSFQKGRFVTGAIKSNNSLLTDVEHEFGRSGSDVVEDVLDDGEVALAALEQDAEVGEVLAAVLPRRPTHGHRVVPPRRLGGNSKGLKFDPKKISQKWPQKDS